MNAVQFQRVPCPSATVVDVEYFERQHSFVTIPVRAALQWSILLRDVELHVDANGLVVAIDGYSPRRGWQISSLAKPAAIPGCIRASTQVEIGRGESIRLAESEWPAYFDPAAAIWVAGTLAVAYSNDVVALGPRVSAVLDSGRLRSVWITGLRNVDGEQVSPSLEGR